MKLPAQDSARIVLDLDEYRATRSTVQVVRSIDLFLTSWNARLDPVFRLKLENLAQELHENVHKVPELSAQALLLQAYGKHGIKGEELKSLRYIVGDRQAPVFTRHLDMFRDVTLDKMWRDNFRAKAVGKLSGRAKAKSLSTPE